MSLPPRFAYNGWRIFVDEITTLLCLKNYFASCNALCVVFVLLCCYCWRLACFLCFLAGLLLDFLFFLFGLPFFRSIFLLVKVASKNTGNTFTEGLHHRFWEFIRAWHCSGVGRWRLQDGLFRRYVWWLSWCLGLLCGGVWVVIREGSVWVWRWERGGREGGRACEGGGGGKEGREGEWRGEGGRGGEEEGRETRDHTHTLRTPFTLWCHGYRRQMARRN